MNTNPYYRTVKARTSGRASATPAGEAYKRPSSQIEETSQFDASGAINTGIAAAGIAGNAYGQGANFQERNFQTGAGEMLQGAQAGFNVAGPAGALAGAAIAPVIGGVSSAIGERQGIKNAELATPELYSQYGNGDPTYQGQGYLQSSEQIGELGQIADSYGNQPKVRGIGETFKLATGKLLGNDRDARRKRDSMLKELRSQQTGFNQASEGFEQREVAQEQYRRNRSRTNRLYNLYSATGQQLY